VLLVQYRDLSPNNRFKPRAHTLIKQSSIYLSSLLLSKQKAWINAAVQLASQWQELHDPTGTTTDMKAALSACCMHDNVSWSNTNTVFCCCWWRKKNRGGVLLIMHGPCKIHYIVIYMCLSGVTYSCKCTYLYTPMPGPSYQLQPYDGLAPRVSILCC
jgi:hypothetical protein